MYQSFAVLVISCDKYADVWPSFFKCFYDCFPKGEWPVYLGSNLEKCQMPGVTPVLSGPDKDWSSSIKTILGQIPEKKIFVIVDDFFLASKVDPDRFLSVLQFMVENDANHIRYWADPLPDMQTEHADIGRCLKGAPYRATVCGFWDKAYLKRLLIDGENPWNFEIMGSYRTSYSEGFYATWTPLCEHKNMIEKGMWIPESVQWANDRGISLSLEARPMLKGGTHIKSLIQVIIFKGVLKIPWTVRVKLMGGLRKLLISY